MLEQIRANHRAAFERLLKAAPNHKPMFLDRWKDGTYRFSFIEKAWREFEVGSAFVWIDR